RALSLSCFLTSSSRRPPTSPLFPSTTLFRSSGLSPRSSRTSSALIGLSPRGVRWRDRRRLKLTAILDRHRGSHGPVPILASVPNLAAPLARHSSASPVGVRGQHSLRFLPLRPW